VNQTGSGSISFIIQYY